MQRGSQQSWKKQEKRELGDEKPGHNRRQLQLGLLCARQCEMKRKERELRVGCQGKVDTKRAG